MCDLVGSTCCFSLKIGSLIIGYSYLSYYVILTICFGIVKLVDEKYLPSELVEFKSETTTEHFVIYLICLLATIVLIIGVHMEQPYLLLLWVIIKVLAMILLIAISVKTFVNTKETSLIFVIIIEVLCTYFTLVIFAFFKQLRGISSSKA